MKNKDNFKKIIDTVQLHQNNIDDLKSWISKNISIFDDNLIEEIINFAKSAQEPRQFRVSIILYKLLEIFASIKNNHDLHVNSLINQGDVLERLCILDEALDCYESALKIVEKNNLEVIQESLCQARIGSVFQKAQMYKHALPFLEKVVKNDETNDNFMIQAESIGNLASAYHGLGEYEKSLKLHQEALTKLRIPEMIMGELSPVTKPLAIELLNTGLTYVELEQYEKAIDYFRESLAAFRRVGQRPNIEEHGGLLGFTMTMLSTYKNGHMPSPFISQEVIALVNISKCAKILGRIAESHSTRDEASRLVMEYGLQDQVNLVRELYANEEK